MHPALLTLERQFSASTLTRLVDPLLQQQHIELWVKRDDLLHPVISGNKWRKLKFILDHALQQNTAKIISMGGAYSNHLHALAFAGKLLGLETVAFIRGEKPGKFSSTLRDIQNWGMDLEFISRSDYRELRNYKDHDSLPGLKAGEYWIPEGGATTLALQGVGEIVDEIRIDYDVLCAPCGTGATLAGLIAAAPDSTQILGIAALKGAGFLVDDVRKLLPDDTEANWPSTPEPPGWQINLDYHFGGFAKSTEQLRTFIGHFEDRHSIILDPVYTGKMLFALFDLIKQGYFNAGQRIVTLHTGGLQGKRQLV